jgi:DNA polymerase (family 10)
LAQQRGLKVSEYGVFRVKDEKRMAGKSEEEVFGTLELPYIPPELRENRGEIEAAAEGKLPELLDLSDIRGDLQMHTTASDGKDSIEKMAEKAKELGYKYVAITDHSKAVRVAGGMDEKELAKHLKAIEKANAKVGGIEILKGVEVDILADGSLDLEDWVLAECDVVLASIHSRFSMPEEEMTERIIKGISNQNVNILGHPTGRLILERPAYQVNLKRVFEAAREVGVVMEINAHPDRLDLNDVNARMAKDMGLKIAINTDAHAATQLELMRFGVYTARRAWLEKKDVINTYPLKKFLKALR